MNFLRRVNRGGYHQKLEDEESGRRKGPLFNFQLDKTKHTKKATRGDSMSCSDFSSTDPLESQNVSLTKKARKHSAENTKNYQFPAIVVEGPAGLPAHRKEIRKQEESARFRSKPRKEGKGLNDFLAMYDSIVAPLSTCSLSTASTVSTSCSDFSSTDPLEEFQNGSLLKGVWKHSAENIKNHQLPATGVEGPAGFLANRGRREIHKQEAARFLSKPRMEGKGLNDFFAEYDSILGEPTGILRLAVRGTQSSTGW
jgi:hypothetical protein